MAKRIIWTERALRDRFEIFRFWVENNKSNTYSIKLDSQFENSAVTLSKFPMAGKKTNRGNVRLFIIKHYSVFYKINGEDLIIQSVWDNRQNPDSKRI